MILVGDVLSINIQVVIYFCIAVYWENALWSEWDVWL